MKSRALQILLILNLITFALAFDGRFSGGKTDDDKTLAPYFHIEGEDALESLPLLSTTADVDIAGVIADVEITQIYKNDGDRPIEAVYIFPASTRAAVYAMKMTIGDRTIEAEIQEKEQARKNYEQAKQEGKSASLLEQKRPNVFQMNVANIMPGDRIEVVLSYTELLVPEDGIYEFAFPTVVGPRYSNTKEEDATSDESWVKNPYLHQNKEPTYDFDINVDLSIGLPIQDIKCETHETDIAYDGKSNATVKLATKEKSGGNRDFILRYKLSGRQIQEGLLLHEGKDENFFLMMVQPPDRIKTQQIPPREYIFIVDISGSMHGFPLDISKQLLRDLIGNLRPGDYFNVLLFAGSSSVMSERSLPATESNIEKAINTIDNQRGGGGTELLPALKRALDLPREEALSRTIVIATDGYVSVEREAFDIIRNNLNRANFFAFGIGSSVNRFLIEGMANAGMGEPLIITKPEQAKKRADKFRQYIQSPVLTQIEAQYMNFDAYDIEPLSIPDVLAERPIIVFGKYRGKAKGTIEISGYTGEGHYKKTIDVDEYRPLEENSAIRYLWARHKIQILSDYHRLGDPDRKEEVIELGLKYNLLTQFTSFVAIDSEIRNQDGEQTTVKQPLPLPQGVSDYAVGGSNAMSMKRYKTPAPSSPQYDATTHEKTPTLKPVDLKGKIQMSISKVSLAGFLTKSEISDFIESNEDAILSCISGEKGSVKIRLVIDSNGDILLEKISGKSLSTRAIKCLENYFENLSIDEEIESKTTTEILLEFK